MDTQILKRLLSFSRPYLKYLLLVLLSSIGQIIFTLLTPILIGQGIDYLVGQGLVEFDLLFHQIIVIMMSVLLTSLFSWLVVRFLT